MLFSLADSTKLENGINDFELYEQNLLPWVQGEEIKFESILFTQTNSSGQVEFEKNPGKIIKLSLSFFHPVVAENSRWNHGFVIHLC